MFERSFDAEDGGRIVVRTFKNRGDAGQWLVACAPDRNHLVKCCARDFQNAAGKQLDLRASHPAGPAARQQVAVHPQSDVRVPSDMPSALSVIIPTRDEESRVGNAVRSAFAAGAAEVIVCDAGSSDHTMDVARAAGAIAMNGDNMRARQLNRAAASAAHECLLFLHADTLLPHGAAEAVAAVLDEGALFGGFRLAFLERAAKLRLAELMINVRTSLTRCPWGDQAQFIRRDEFLAGGGFREIPIMEDYELATRMKKRGRIAILPLTVHTSGRRFLDKGVLRTAALNWRIILAWRLGADPVELAAIYRR